MGAAIITHAEVFRAVSRISRGAVQACNLVAEGGEWTPRTPFQAALALEGSRAATGVSERRWLAGRLRRVGAMLLARELRPGQKRPAAAAAAEVRS